MFSKQIESNDVQTKTIYTVEKWRLIINKVGPRYQLSLIDKWDIKQPIHQLIIYKHPEESQNTSVTDLLKQMLEGKSSNKLQFLKHAGSFVMIYGPYGLLGGGKTQQWIAGTTSIIGIVGGVVIVFNGSPLGKILIDTSTDLLIHACLAPEVTTDNCLETVSKSAVISVFTNGVFTLIHYLAKRLRNKFLP